MLADVTPDATSGIRGEVPAERRASDPRSSVATGITDAEYERFVQAVHARRTLIGVDRAFAKKLYTSVPMDTMERTIGEVPYFEKGIVCCAVFASPVLLFAAIVLSVFGIGWWAMLAAPIATAAWIFNRKRSASDEAGIALLTLSLLAPVVLPLFGWVGSAWVLGALASFLLALWCDRLIYVASSSFLRKQVLRNRRALAAYAEGLSIRNVS